MYVTLKQWYFWNGMRSDCLVFCQRCVACKAERAKFVGHRTLSPWDKGCRPFTVWCLDLIILPPGSEGQTVAVVCVDVFSKFVVAKALPNKSSDTLAQFFYSHIICEYSVPVAVRCDNGTEFAGSFNQLLA